MPVGWAAVSPHTTAMSASSICRFCRRRYCMHNRERQSSSPGRNLLSRLGGAFGARYVHLQGTTRASPLTWTQAPAPPPQQDCNSIVIDKYLMLPQWLAAADPERAKAQPELAALPRCRTGKPPMCSTWAAMARHTTCPHTTPPSALLQGVTAPRTRHHRRPL